MIGAAGKEIGSSPQGSWRALLRLLWEESRLRHPACWVPRGSCDEARQREKEKEATNKKVWLRSLDITGGCMGLQGGQRRSGSGKQRMMGVTTGGCSVGPRLCVLRDRQTNAEVK